MRSREDQVRSTFTVNEAIQQIEKLGGVYDPTNKSFDVYDQLLACEAVAEATPVNSYLDTETKDNKESAFDYKNGNDTYKRQVNFELTTSKLEAIEKLKQCDYKTPPPQIVPLLEVIFEGCETQSGWWLSVVQQWNPRTIVRVINQLLKVHSGGWKTIRNPAAYFTSIIKHRRKRKSIPIMSASKKQNQQRSTYA